MILVIQMRMQFPVQLSLLITTAILDPNFVAVDSTAL